MAASFAAAAAAPIANSAAIPSSLMSGGLSLTGLLSSLVSLGGGMMSTGGGLFSSALNYRYNKKLQDRAFAHQIRMYQNQHQWEVEDLRKAGLNPILSTHAASSMPTAPSASVHVPDFGQNFKFDNLIDYLSKEQGFKNSKQMYAFNELMHMLQLEEIGSRIGVNSALSSKYISEAMSEDAERSFQYSPTMKELRKRKIFTEGTKNLWQSYGDMDERLINLLYNYNPWSAQSNNFHGKVIPRKKYENSSLSRLK